MEEEEQTQIVGARPRMMVFNGDAIVNLNNEEEFVGSIKTIPRNWVNV